MLHLLIITFVSIAIFAVNINSFPLRNWDEAWYAQVTRNMADGHSLLMPFWNGQYFPDKPPLYFWLSLPFLKLFGVGEWQARIVAVASALLASLLVYLIASKLFNRTTGIISFLVFVTLGQIVVRFSHGNLDSLLVCLFLATFYFYLIAERRKVFYVLCGITLGLGFLVKGWGLGLFPLFAIGIYSILIKRQMPKGLVIIMLSSILSSGWYFLAGVTQFGESFLNWYILNPTQSGLNFSLPSDSFIYFRYLFRDVGFWFIPVVASILTKFPQKRKIVFALFTTVSLFILTVNFSREKFDWYILPAYPFVAILVGHFTERLLNARPKVASILLVLVLTTQIINIVKIENAYPDHSEVGANLGKHAQQLIPKGETIVLDDRDFTSFLFYSEHGTVYVTSREGNKPGEWWFVKYEDLEIFINNNKPTWFITSDPGKISTDKLGGKIVDEYNAYTFIRFQK